VKHENFCLQLSTYLEDTWDFGARGIRARGLSDFVEGQLEILKPRQDWLQLDKGDLGFQL
jgi:hypothetical protein